MWGKKHVGARLCMISSSRLSTGRVESARAKQKRDFFFFFQIRSHAHRKTSRTRPGCTNLLLYGDRECQCLAQGRGRGRAGWHQPQTVVAIIQPRADTARLFQQSNCWQEDVWLDVLFTCCIHAMRSRQGQNRTPLSLLKPASTL